MGIKRNGGGLAAGSIAPFAGAVIPAGWLECAGQAVSRADYAGLFLAIGTQYGVGDGGTTFNVPDLRGRAIFGKDNMNGSAANRLTSGGGGVNGAALGAVGGGQSVTLTSGEIPAHGHTERFSGSSSGGPGSLAINATAHSVATNTVSVNTTGNTGTGGAHTNVPPALVANYIIKT